MIELPFDDALSQIENLGEKLISGDVFSVPTDTVRGFLGICDAPIVIQAIRNMKGRDFAKPFLVLTDGIERIRPYVEITDYQRQVLMLNWPGPFSFIFALKKLAQNPLRLAACNQDSIGIRWPHDYLAVGLIRATKSPLVSTSFNLSGGEELTFSEVSENEDFSAITVWVKDSELKKSGSQSSCVVSLLNDEVNILRAGPLPLKLPKGESYVSET
jgi:L-threonylcarbamoyladenylate synthase